MSKTENPLFCSTARAPEISPTLSQLVAVQVRSNTSMAAAEKILAGVEAVIVRVEGMRPAASEGLRAQAVYDESLAIHEAEVRRFREEYALFSSSLIKTLNHNPVCS